MDERERLFQAAVETIDLAKVPTLGGWTRKLAEVEDHKAHGGKVKEGGCLVVQSARKTDYRMEKAIDLLGCLPEKRRGVALIFARYCPPNMLEDYPGIKAEITANGLKDVGQQWEGWTDETNGASGYFVGRFWAEARKRKILRSRKAVANF